MSSMHVEALRAESSRAQVRFEKQMNRLEKELSTCQDAKRRLEAEIATSMHGAHASRTHSGGQARNGSSGALSILRTAHTCLTKGLLHAQQYPFWFFVDGPLFTECFGCHAPSTAGSPVVHRPCIQLSSGVLKGRRP